MRTGIHRIQLFQDEEELLRFAMRFITERVESLENDVRRCLLQEGPYRPAPFPALLYCFATIDLLGGLYSGNASKSARTSPQAREYMEKFMNYKTERTKLIQELFRHKLVHLAQPGPVVEDGGRRISWCHHHENREKHLLLEKLPTKGYVPLTSKVCIECNYVFHVSIADLVRDIRDSVENPGGYLASLESSQDLQQKFEKAISQVYDRAACVQAGGHE